MEINFNKEFEKINLLKLSNELCYFANEDEKHYEQCFQEQIVELFKTNYSTLYNLTQSIKAMLFRQPFFVVLKGLNFNSLDEKIRDVFILGFTSSIGYSTPTDLMNKKVLWPVKAETNSAVKNLTFSQRLGEAEYHTDAQYFKNPEELLSLWCLKSDKNGDGISGLISADYLISEIKKRTRGESIIKTLTETKFPFRVPSIFTSEGTDEKIEISYGHIFSDKPKIRYRKETIDKGCIAGNILLTKEQEYALEVVEEILNYPKEEIKLFLNENEVIFMNNHELLHNRSSYFDEERHLIRVRNRI